MVTTNTWTNPGEFLTAVRHAGLPNRANVDPRLQTPSASAPGMRTDISSEGGFLVPPDFADTIVTKMYNTNEILRRCEDFGQPAGNEHHVPYYNETSRADGSRFGGVRTYWVQEAGELTDSKPDLGLQKRKLKKVAGLCYVTDEMFEDAPRLAQNLENMSALELGFVFEENIVNGTGAGRPQGLLNADAKIEISKVTNQTAATVWGQNIIDMMARLWGPSQRSAVWLFNQELLDQLSVLTVDSTYGSAGSVQVESRLWNWDGNAYSGGWPTLAGRPAIPSEHCQAPGTEGDLILTDLSQYGIVAKPRTDISMHIRFLNNEGAFRFVLRCDGCSFWSSPLTPKYGTDTLSPIVTLETRS
jgi:HK97 family phage major capsid protein